MATLAQAKVYDEVATSAQAKVYDEVATLAPAKSLMRWPLKVKKRSMAEWSGG